MKSIFDKIRQNGETEIIGLVSARTQENPYLEFKEKSNCNVGEFNNDDKRNLAKEISAFSNSGGGLLIWGVEARKMNGIDCAINLKPISEIDKFYAIAMDLVGELVRPVNDGIHFEKVPCSADKSKGYLAIWIERSERRPHRSEAKGDKQYFKRVGDSAYSMEHFDIEDAFRRVARADLNIGYSIHANGGGSVSGPQDKKMKIVLRLENVSNYSARFPYLRIIEVSGGEVDEYGIDGNHGLGLPMRPFLGGSAFAGGADHVIHPGDALEVAAIKQVLMADVDLELSQSVQFLSHAVPRDEPFLRVECEFGCADSPRQRVLLTIEPEEILWHKEAAARRG